MKPDCLPRTWLRSRWKKGRRTMKSIFWRKEGGCSDSQSSMENVVIATSLTSSLNAESKVLSSIPWCKPKMLCMGNIVSRGSFHVVSQFSFLFRVQEKLTTVIAFKKKNYFKNGVSHHFRCNRVLLSSSLKKLVSWNHFFLGKKKYLEESRLSHILIKEIQKRGFFRPFWKECANPNHFKISF